MHEKGFEGKFCIIFKIYVTFGWLFIVFLEIISVVVAVMHVSFYAL